MQTGRPVPPAVILSMPHRPGKGEEETGLQRRQLEIPVKHQQPDQEVDRINFHLLDTKKKRKPDLCLDNENRRQGNHWNSLKRTWVSLTVLIRGRSVDQRSPHVQWFHSQMQQTHLPSSIRELRSLNRIARTSSISQEQLCNKPPRTHKQRNSLQTVKHYRKLQGTAQTRIYELVINWQTTSGHDSPLLLISSGLSQTLTRQTLTQKMQR